MTNEEYAAVGVDNCAILQYEFSGEENGALRHECRKKSRHGYDAGDYLE